MLSNFDHLLPEVIFEAVETLGGRCTGRFLALNAMENRVYDCEMEEGENRIIKFYRPGRWSRETILTEHRFLEVAEAEEVPVVCPLKDEKGETLHEKDGVFFTQFPKRPGRLEPELNREQLERLGRFLGRIHNAGEKLKGAARGRLDPDTFGKQSVAYLMEEKLLPPGLAPTYDTFVKQICEMVAPAFANAKFILTHGDCHAGNVLWNHSNPYFIDFDDMLYAPAVQDMWMLIGGDDEYAMENIAHLIKHYEEIRQFDRSELKLIEPLRSLRMVYFSTWIARRREDGAFKAAFPHFGTEKYWQQQIEHMSHQLERLRQAMDSDNPLSGGLDPNQPSSDSPHRKEPTDGNR